MREPLEQLQAELRAAEEAERSGGGDPAKIAALKAEIDRRLDEDDHEGVVDELRDQVRDFEASHPRLAAAIGQAADSLSALGL
jgi:hypothetical protein